VDAERIRVQYARALADGSGILDPAYVEGLFKADAAYLASAMSPLEKRLADLEAKLAAVPVADVNAQTQHAVLRAKTPPLAPVGAAPSPAAVVRKREPVPYRNLSDMNAAWVHRRD
jgi:hypothetical protein